MVGVLVTVLLSVPRVKWLLALAELLARVLGLHLLRIRTRVPLVILLGRDA